MSIFVVSMILLAVVLLVFVIPRSETTSDLRAPGDSSVDEGLPGNDNGMTESTCSAAGGTWNPCGSACRTNPDALCIELCVEYCECETNLECPSGYSCGDFVDGVGVCL